MDECCPILSTLPRLSKLGYNPPMRTASIILALVEVLSFSVELGAQTTSQPKFKVYSSIRNPGVLSAADLRTVGYAIHFDQYSVGFVDVFIGKSLKQSLICIGPLGSYQSPFTATQGLIAFIAIVAVLVIASIAAVVGWRRKRVPVQ